MEVRKFLPGEESEIWALFRNTVRCVCIRDYSREQVEAWANANLEPKALETIRKLQPYVAVLDERIVAYADIQSDGYIDHFFVHHECQGKGVGRILFEKLKQHAQDKNINHMYANVSITARPFFEKLGFRVEQRQSVTLQDQVLENYRMSMDVFD